MSKAEYTTPLTYMSLIKKKRDWLIDTLVFLGKRWSWQPIETAPRDGTTILIWANGTLLGWWSSLSSYRADGSLDAGGWTWEHGRIDGVTHWMPLPEPPCDLELVTND